MGRGKKSIFYERVNILYQETFWRRFFKKHPEYENIPKEDVKKMAYDFFDTCGDLLVNQPNGIVLDGLGYFANAVFDIRITNPLAKKPIYRSTFNLITDGKIYRATYFPRIFKYSPLNNWSFHIEEKRRSHMAEKIRNGIKYLCHYNLLKKQKNNGRKYFLRRFHK